MDLIPITNYPNYSLDKNTNQVYNTKYNRYLKSHSHNKGYYLIKLSKNNIPDYFLLHRLIYQVYNPDIDITNLQIDHIDNNKTNNNIENLRHCNNSENQCNTKVHKNNLLGIKNIHKTKNNTYTVHINKNKINYNKTLETIEEAILWRDNKLLEMHCNFANLG
tara:strand:- start:850 stop:1338 length:489 start_codon:yes stop_codon:yes gene_type:complete